MTTKSSLPSKTRKRARCPVRPFFEYRQKGDLVWAEYSGGAILFGTLIAKCDEEGNLDMRYQHLNRDGELMTGICHSRPEILEDKRIRLYEKWRWDERRSFRRRIDR